MHILAGQARGIDEQNEAVDLEQDPADILFLSAADTELALMTSAVQQCAPCYSVRAASFLALTHPYSVDLYCERTVQGSRLVVLRLLGGAHYWNYGLEQLEMLARRGVIDLAVMPGDDKWDEVLAARSSLPVGVVKRLWRYFVEGGPANVSAALEYAASLKGLLPGLDPNMVAEPRPLPKCGYYASGMEFPTLREITARFDGERPVAALVFYRALYQSGALAPADALISALQAQGLNVLPLYVSSLKDAECAAVVQQSFDAVKPSVVLNATAFALSKAGAQHFETILDAPGAPVLQVVFSSISQGSWAESTQGLSPRDLAMHVVLPEVDGRVLTRAVSFKEDGEKDPLTQWAPVRFAPKDDRITYVAALAANWAKLSKLPEGKRRVALVLANYPNKDGRLANGVGLDTPASCAVLLAEMKAAGYDVGSAPLSSAELMALLSEGPTNALEGRGARRAGETLSLEAYMRCFAQLPMDVQRAVRARWGGPECDPYVAGGEFRLSLHRFGNVVVGIQPARGYNIDPKATYHHPDLVPPHNYFAWYFHVRSEFGADAVVHLGKHGNLEWLPGKALALSESCFPEAVLGPTPNIYPFIVNDPGEGAQAKRRTAAVIIDHLTPPLARAESHGVASEMENLLDEFYQASGVDTRRCDVLAKELLDLAATHGLDLDIGLTSDMDEETRLARLDAHLCDLKELQIRDGLHVFGRKPEGRPFDEMKVALLRVPRGQSANDQSLLRALSKDLIQTEFDPLSCDFAGAYTGPKPDFLAKLSGDLWRSNGDAVERLELLCLKLVTGELPVPEGWQATSAVMEGFEKEILPRLASSSEREVRSALRALGGGFVEPGPSGAPSRGRPDVLPTGRNFYSVDVRGVPTQTAWQIGARSAEALMLRHFQDEGEWLDTLVLSCWGTANMRTGGDDIAQALALIGARPIWEPGSGRVTGFEVVPLSELQRPRVDVTLRVSGFFRDAFPQLMHLFDQAVGEIARLEEPEEANPLAAHVRKDALKLRAEGHDEQSAWQRAAFRVFGSKPGAYGAGLQALIDEGIWSDRADFAEAFVAWGGYAYGVASDGVNAPAELENRLGAARAVVHNQDNREHDLLDSDDYYQFEGGLSASIERFSGKAPTVYHNDHSRPERPVIRTLSEEIGRVVRGRAANPKWIAGVMRHGYKGAFEMAATLDYLFAFGATTNAVKDHHFDQLHEAYFENDEVLAFLRESNPAALREMALRFQEAIERGLWVPRRNSVHVNLKEITRA
ncbi:cobaltochelatase subunit CobN [Pseudovibrio exalbescens]|uniref:cobaltochelatase subunit CobN n=1 Tax=Pseudovibrio exalbescens TaxID=197461 RepID=UPI002365F6C4|nr:cobaltochelatase subunit CobN [Pseudovibrio exalbescens]MDD7908451.1 cobaltochelatase subunit CobN [Pseudovibrio exalbescens]